MYYISKWDGLGVMTRLSDDDDIELSKDSKPIGTFKYEDIKGKYKIFGKLNPLFNLEDSYVILRSYDIQMYKLLQSIDFINDDGRNLRGRSDYPFRKRSGNIYVSEQGTPLIWRTEPPTVEYCSMLRFFYANPPQAEVADYLVWLKNFNDSSDDMPVIMTVTFKDLGKFLSFLGKVRMLGVLH